MREFCNRLVYKGNEPQKNSKKLKNYKTSGVEAEKNVGFFEGIRGRPGGGTFQRTKFGRSIFGSVYIWSFLALFLDNQTRMNLGPGPGCAPQLSEGPLESSDNGGHHGARLLVATLLLGDAIWSPQPVGCSHGIPDRLPDGGGGVPSIREKNCGDNCCR